MESDFQLPISINRLALKIVNHMIDETAQLGLRITNLPGGTTILDAGVETPASLEAGRLFSEVCLGGLGRVNFCQTNVGLPGVNVWVSRPPVACMASQYAGLSVKKNEFFALGSGPARSICCRERLFERLAYKDEADVAVLTLEANRLPDEAVAQHVAELCAVAPDHLFLLVAPTASLVGSVQVAARVVETGMHKMVELGFDVNTVLSGIGTCPLAPVADDDLRAMGWTNDAVLYGGSAWYTLDTDDILIEEIIDRMPSSASRDYGTPFYDLLQRYEGEFYKIDPLLFSPAEVYINNIASGRTFHSGSVNAEMAGVVISG